MLKEQPGSPLTGSPPPAAARWLLGSCSLCQRLLARCPESWFVLVRTGFFRPGGGVVKYVCLYGIGCLGYVLSFLKISSFLAKGGSKKVLEEAATVGI